jgi:Asp-tRNA(Asn)/Glu-tRNA(Gln) amidotransferase A subunit family amidase
VLERFEEAVADMRRAGATVIDSVMIPEIDELRRSGLWCRRFKYDINAYLATLGPNAPVRTLDGILASNRYHPTIQPRLAYFQQVADDPDTDESCQRARENQVLLRAAVRRQLEAHQLDALVFPTWANAPRLIGDLNTPHGDNSQDLAPHTGFPAISVPMGYVRGTLPVGLQILGDAWSESTIIALAYAYEQATHHRIPPRSTPPLRR